jgi:hypothetical protein
MRGTHEDAERRQTDLFEVLAELGFEAELTLGAFQPDSRKPKLGWDEQLHASLLRGITENRLELSDSRQYKKKGGSQCTGRYYWVNTDRETSKGNGRNDDFDSVRSEYGREGGGIAELGRGDFDACG